MCMCKLTQKLRLLLSRKKNYLFYVAKCEVPLNFDYATCSTLYVHNELRPLLFPQSISTQNSQLNKRKINENRTNKLCILAFFSHICPFAASVYIFRSVEWFRIRFVQQKNWSKANLHMWTVTTFHVNEDTWNTYLSR